MTKMCYHPWVGLDISPQGNFKPCCKYRKFISNTLEGYQTSEELATIRQQFLRGERPDGCARCWADEDAGLPSKRTLDNEYVFKNQEPDLSSIKVLGIAFGNTCNLACRICNSFSSSRWNTEANKLKTHFPEIQIFTHNKFYKDKKFIEDIKSVTKDVIHVEIAGGDPFYADADVHHEYIKNLATYSPENISLHYITNATNMPDGRLLELWKQFKKIDIQLSIDGTKKQFEYNRWPSRWTDVLLNIGRWVEYKKNNNNIQLSISHTVSIFTIHALPDFLVWCEHHGLPKPYLGLLSRPDYYSITVLPESAKHDIERKFNLYSIANDLQPVINAMWAKDDSHLLDTMIKYVKILDKQRKQSFQETFPETYQLLGEQCQTLYQLY